MVVLACEREQNREKMHKAKKLNKKASEPSEGKCCKARYLLFNVKPDIFLPL